MLINSKWSGEWKSTRNAPPNALFLLTHKARGINKKLHKQPDEKTSKTTTATATYEKQEQSVAADHNQSTGES